MKPPLIIITTILVLLNPKIGFCKTKTWPSEEYTYVKAYLYNLKGKPYKNHVITKDDILDSTIVDERTISSITDIEEIKNIAKSEALNIGLNKCYTPHHSIVFYNKNDKPIAYVTICFYCKQIKTYPEAITVDYTNLNEFKKSEVKKAEKDLKKLKKIMLKIKLPVFNSIEEYRNYKSVK